MAFRPLHDRVLVRRIEAQEKTAGGIIIPDTAQEKPQEGEVVSVGSGTRGEDGNVTPLDLKEGDRIRFSGTFFRDNEQGLQEKSLTFDGQMNTPNFVFRFSSISAL